MGSTSAVGWRGGARRMRTFVTWRLRDWLMTKGLPWLSVLGLLAYAGSRLAGRRSSLRYLMSAHRYRPDRLLTALVARALRRQPEEIAGFVDPVPVSKLDLVAQRSIVLKMPVFDGATVEKGILLLTFTETSAFFHHHVDCQALLRFFYVVLEPSWSGYCDPNILFWTRYPDSPVVVQATEDLDFRFLESLESNLVPVPFGASDWVDFRLFRPVPGVGKTYDVVYVTNYNPVKRHHLLLRAIAELRDPSYRAALVFGKWGSSRDAIHELIDHYGVRANLEIFDGLDQHEVNVLLNMSKVNVLLSRKEGSNRSIFEGFFANTPGIVLKRNIGVRKSYINERTGLLVDEHGLARALARFRTAWDRFEPRSWALENISPLRSTQKLGECIRRLAMQRGEPWTGEPVPKVNVPEVTYFEQRDAARMAPSRALLSVFRRQDGAPRDDMQIRRKIEALCDAGPVSA